MNSEQMELVRELGKKVKSDEITWANAAKIYNDETGESLSGNAIRKRFGNLKDENYVEPIKSEKIDEEFETYHKNGTIEICKKEVWFDKNEEKTPDNVLQKFGYDPKEWELQTWRFGKWEVAIADEDENRVCTTIRAVIKPKRKTELSREDYLEIVKQSMKEVVKPLKLEKTKPSKDLDDNKMMEFPATELHLGKLAWHGDTGQDYDQQIAKARFRHIIQETIKTQDIYKANTLFMTIGNDFFNSDTVDATTTKGTYQCNDIRWKKMFLVGLNLYKEALLTLRDEFGKIDIQLCQGNHDVMSSYYLYIALSQFFINDDKINFSDNLKTTQCYSFGKVAIFTNHGDTNLKRLIKSISAEFYEEWGKSVYRELHLGHLHHEMVVDDDSGLITRRLGSPTGTDEWHYNSRFIGNTQKQQLFIWDKENGLIDQRFICFENNNKKKTLIYKKKPNS